MVMILTKKARGESGQTLVEILVAIAMVVLVLVAVVGRSVDSVRNSIFSRNEILATRFAQEGIEWGRSQRDRLGWNAFVAALDSYPVTYCVLDLSQKIEDLTSGACTGTISGTVFTREVSLSYQDEASPLGDYIDLSVTVNWTDRIGDHTSNLGTRLSQWIK
jgi:type II secretory pathway pseudopilin PulG